MSFTQAEGRLVSKVSIRFMSSSIEYSRKNKIDWSEIESNHPDHHLSVIGTGLPILRRKSLLWP
jgi:hypothetical protein